MGKRGFIAYDPILAREKFNADMVIAIYYEKLLRYDQILAKDSEGFFTRGTREIEKATCIKRAQQDKARRWLESQSHILTKVKTRPGTAISQMHFKIIDKKPVK